MRQLLLCVAVLGLAASAAARTVTDFGGPRGRGARPGRARPCRGATRLGAGLCPGARQARGLVARRDLGRARLPRRPLWRSARTRPPDRPRDTANLEVVLRVKPDLILDFGSVAGTYVSLANRVQEQTGIPYLLIDGRFANTAAALRLAGELLGVPERAERLATFAGIDEVLASIPSDARPRAYLARGPDGLETGLRGSINTEIVERVGAINVADAGPDRQGIAQVQLEQVLAWNPDTIVTWDDRFYRSVKADPAWAGVAAVQQGRVSLSPGLPFGWIDRPPTD